MIIVEVLRRFLNPRHTDRLYNYISWIQNPRSNESHHCISWISLNMFGLRTPDLWAVWSTIIMWKLCGDVVHITDYQSISLDLKHIARRNEYKYYIIIIISLVSRTRKTSDSRSVWSIRQQNHQEEDKSILMANINADDDVVCKNKH